jgi:GntR family transcriptional regulator, transcriptional repressor for pyruvate dehydrogenase complex
MAFNEVVRSPVYVQVAEQLRGAILSGELAPGAELPTERELAETFGASRASVREALRVLEAQGLIEGGGAPTRAVVAEESVGPVRDALVTLLRLNRVELDDLVELRCLLESAALRRAAGRRDRTRLGEARQALEDMRAPGVSVESFDAADVRFHLALVRASGNEAMHLVMLALHDAVARHLLAALRAQRDPRRLFRRLLAEHEAIIEAVEAGDAERAATLMETHLRRFYRTYGRQSSRDGGGGRG